MPRKPRLPRVPEKVEQQQIVALLRSLGAAVYVLGTRRRRGDYPGTMQTPGVPDLFAVSHKWGVLFVEVKATGGRLRLDQAVFAEVCQRAGVPHVVGGLDHVIAWLVAAGYLKESQVAAYRLPAQTSAPDAH